MSGDRVHARRREGSPPAREFFSSNELTPAGTLTASLVLPGLSLTIDGMDEEWHAAFLTRYAGFANDGDVSKNDALRFSALTCRRDHFIEPPAPGVVEYNPVFVEVEKLPGPPSDGRWRVRMCTYDLAATFSTGAGSADNRVVLARGTFDPRERAVENLIRVTTAWTALSRGGLLMHSASIVHQDRAYLFFGQSGAGKSTLSAASRRGRVMSDDLTLMLPGASGRPEAVGAPFRGTYTGGEPVHGRFPVAAAFRLLKAGPGEEARVETLDSGRALAVAMANLPFVVDQLHLGADVFARVERVLGAFPIRGLRFRKENDSWWDAVLQAFP